MQTVVVNIPEEKGISDQFYRCVSRVSTGLAAIHLPKLGACFAEENIDLLQSQRDILESIGSAESLEGRGEQILVPSDFTNLTTVREYLQRLLFASSRALKSC